MLPIGQPKVHHVSELTFRNRMPRRLGRESQVQVSRSSPLHVFHHTRDTDSPTIQQLISLTMAWRNQGITGSNNIPLGARRRFGGSDSAPPDDGGYNPSQPSTGISDGSYKRGRSPERGKRPELQCIPLTTDATAAEVVGDGERRRKKRNRWGDAAENKAAGLMGLPTMIKANMTTEQLEAYTLHLRIQEISEKLRINDVVPADGDR